MLTQTIIMSNLFTCNVKKKILIHLSPGSWSLRGVFALVLQIMFIITVRLFTNFNHICAKPNHPAFLFTENEMVLNLLFSNFIPSLSTHRFGRIKTGS